MIVVVRGIGKLLKCDHLVVDPLIQFISVLIMTVLFSEIVLKGKEKYGEYSHKSPVGSKNNDLDAITHNLDELSSLLNKNSALMVVVKAEGYGHGLVRKDAETLSKNGN